MSEHVEKKRVYFIIFAILIFLTALTTTAAYIDLGAMNTVVALLIAVCKGLLVVLFFMHVRHMENLVRLVVVASFFWLAVLIVISLSDFATRSWIPTPNWMESTSTPSIQVPPSPSLVKPAPNPE